MPTVFGAVDCFSIFRHAVSLQGWCFSPGGPVIAMELRTQAQPDTPGRRFAPDWTSSADIVPIHGPEAHTCRFDAIVPFGPHAPPPTRASVLYAILDEAAPPVEFCRLGTYSRSTAAGVPQRFFAMLAEQAAADAPLRVLEIGARARSGVTRSDLLPAAASYTGCDVLPGPNVDVVCDAHDLSSALSHATYQAVMAFSVLEHLLMPWKVMLELNRVMAPGALGLFTTHQAWPLHDAPWDYWRFSDQAWAGLLNPATGFEIIEAAMGEPAYILAAHCHAATDFPRRAAGFLASNVLFRKIGETALRWDVAAEPLVQQSYPA